ncbi:Tetratricopeptide Repeat Protein 28 [Manis pentadactyla]|nr:Tetratricopeptide Repeat Protein 28 [Manis pentadactyla]
MEQSLPPAPDPTPGPTPARSRRRREPESPPVPAPIPLFGVKPIGRRSPDGPVLSKAEFVEKVRQSNQACHDGDFHTAIVLYNEALAVDPQNCILYSNRSAAYMKIQQYDKALDDAIKARLLNPKWPKKLAGMCRVHYSCFSSGSSWIRSSSWKDGLCEYVSYNVLFGTFAAI